MEENRVIRVDNEILEKLKTWARGRPGSSNRQALELLGPQLEPDMKAALTKSVGEVWLHLKHTGLTTITNKV